MVRPAASMSTLEMQFKFSAVFSLRHLAHRSNTEDSTNNINLDVSLDLSKVCTGRPTHSLDYHNTPRSMHSTIIAARQCYLCRR